MYPPTPHQLSLLSVSAYEGRTSRINTQHAFTLTIEHLLALNSLEYGYTV